MSTITVTDANFEKEILEAPEVTLVDFWATWCIPCRQVTAIVEQLAEEYKGRIKVGKLNIEDSASTAARFGIKTIPTVIVFKGGKVFRQVVGVMPRDHFAKLVEEALAG